MAKIKVAERPPVVEELHFRSESAFLCLLLNRRTKIIRVIDFRAGALPAKRLFIQSIAQREGIEKVVILVEKDEVASWTRVGFVREGTIPGFYKRSDGHLCGCVIGDRTASIEVSDDGQKAAERTVAAAKKAAADIPEELRGVALRGVESPVAYEARDAAWAAGEGLGGFDPFGRGVLRLFLEAGVKAKGQRPNYLSVEFQDCFGHALVEILRSPRGDAEVLGITAGLRAFGDELKKRGIVSVFGLGPADDVPLSTAYCAAGFKKTGLLARGIQVGDERRDAILWTRKLFNPAGEPGLED
jgi:hypothetical protein